MIDRTFPTLLVFAAGFTLAVVGALVYVAVDRWQARRKARRAAAARAARPHSVHAATAVQDAAALMTARFHGEQDHA